MLDEFFVEFGKCPKCGCEVFSEKNEIEVMKIEQTHACVYRNIW